MKLYESPVLFHNADSSCFAYKCEMFGKRPFACDDIVFELWDVKPGDSIKFKVYDKPGSGRHEFLVYGCGEKNHHLHFGAWAIVRMYSTLGELIKEFYPKSTGPYYVEVEIQ